MFSLRIACKRDEGNSIWRKRNSNNKHTIKRATHYINFSPSKKLIRKTCWIKTWHTRDSTSMRSADRSAPHRIPTNNLIIMQLVYLNYYIWAHAWSWLCAAAELFAPHTILTINISWLPCHSLRRQINYQFSILPCTSRRYCCSLFE